MRPSNQNQIRDLGRKNLIKNKEVKMRHNHKLIRQDMQESGKFCNDICCLSIADILQLIEYNKYLLSISGEELKYLMFPDGNPEKRQSFSTMTIHDKSKRNLIELNAYIFEFNMRLSNRTADFQLSNPKEN